MPSTPTTAARPSPAARAARAVLAVGASAALAATLLTTQSPSAQAVPPADFLAAYAEDAQAGEREHGVPTSVALAQAALESGWGESSLTADGNAFFGIKCGVDNGPYATGCVTKETTECDDSGCHPVTAEFRAYASHADSFRDHGDFLRGRAHYDPAFAHSDDPDQFVREIHAAGYATDPDYADKIIGLMQRYDMYRYNLSGGGGTPARPVVAEGDRGAAVSEAQTLLNAAGGYGLDVDGIFGPATTTAVRDFQTRHTLQVDGIIGPNTWSVLAG